MAYISKEITQMKLQLKHDRYNIQSNENLKKREGDSDI